MVLDLDTLKHTLKMILNTKDSEFTCEECGSLMDQLAEVKVAKQDLPEALELVQHHLEICPECDEVFQALLDTLNALEKTD